MPERTPGFLLAWMVASMTAAWFLVGQGEALCSSESVEKIPEEQRTYVGAAGCTCHQKEEQGRQYQRWTGAKHARSYLVLWTGYPQRIAEEARGLVDMGHGKAVAEEARRLRIDTHCLACHGTAAADTALWGPSFHVEDGVQCEACHGPASAHVATMKNIGKQQKPPMEAQLKRPIKEDCRGCHREKPSHAMLNKTPFNYEKAWKKIVHPIPKR